MGVKPFGEVARTHAGLALTARRAWSKRAWSMASKSFAVAWLAFTVGSVAARVKREGNAQSSKTGNVLWDIRCGACALEGRLWLLRVVARYWQLYGDM